MSNSLEIMRCENDDMLKEVADFADVVWHEYFPFLLTDEQIDYMVEKFQSFEAMKEQTKHQHYTYYQVLKDNEMIGYIGLKFEPDRLFLSKLYLKKSARGNHYASQMFDFVFAQGRKQCYPSVYLTCNKKNTHSLDVYEKVGFSRVADEVTDIGNGFVMDDYVYEYVL